MGNDNWSNATVRNILRNKAYIGKTFAPTRSLVEAKKHRKANRKHKHTATVFRPESEWVEVPNATPAIISEDLFNQAQAKVKRNKELASRNAKRNYLLRGYLICNHCGRRYTGATKLHQTTHGTKHYQYYRCDLENPTHCHKRRWSAKNLERIVWKQIEAVLSNPEVVLAGLKTIQEEVNKASSYPTELEMIKTKLSQVESEIDTEGIQRACKLISNNLAELSISGP